MININVCIYPIHSLIKDIYNLFFHPAVFDSPMYSTNPTRLDRTNKKTLNNAINYPNEIIADNF